MKINDYIFEKYNIAEMQKKSLENRGDNYPGTDQDNENLKKLTDEFTSILLHKMFASMRSTLPENKLLTGGFAEEVFTDMYDKEVSKMGSKQQNFNGLSELLYKQLLEKQKL